MNKRAEDGIDTEDIEETAAEKNILVFDPAGFVIKLIISIYQMAGIPLFLLFFVIFLTTKTICSII